MTADNYEDLVMTLRRRPVLRSTPGKMDLDDAVIADSIEALVKERHQLRDELARVREALVAALEYDGGVSYEDDEDSVGYHVCCSGASYNPHRPYCWVPKARSALAAGKGEEQKP